MPSVTTATSSTLLSGSKTVPGQHADFLSHGRVAGQGGARENQTHVRLTLERHDRQRRVPRAFGYTWQRSCSSSKVGHRPQILAGTLQPVLPQAPWQAAQETTSAAKEDRRSWKLLLPVKEQPQQGRRCSRHQNGPVPLSWLAGFYQMAVLCHSTNVHAFISALDRHVLPAQLDGNSVHQVMASLNFSSLGSTFSCATPARGCVHSVFQALAGPPRKVVAVDSCASCSAGSRKTVSRATGFKWYPSPQKGWPAPRRQFKSCLRSAHRSEPRPSAPVKVWAHGLERST